MYAIRTANLTKKYKDIIAVDQLNLQVKKGELFSLLGVNGAGKTTTIKMLSCLTKPTGGDALVGGYSIIKEPEQVKRLIGVSPQETAVAPNLSVKENLELICGIHRFSKEKIIGIAGTVVVHVLLALLLYFLVLDTPPTPPEKGIEVVLGMDVENVAMAKPVEVMPVASTSPVLATLTVASVPAAPLFLENVKSIAFCAIVAPQKSASAIESKSFFIVIFLN